MSLQFSYSEWKSKSWPIDFQIFFGHSDLTDDELADYQRKLEDALTANGNFGVVALNDNNFDIYADAHGDNVRFVELLGEMYKREAWVEVFVEYDDGDSDLHEITGEEWTELMKRLGLNSEGGF